MSTYDAADGPMSAPHDLAPSPYQELRQIIIELLDDGRCSWDTELIERARHAVGLS